MRTELSYLRLDSSVEECLLHVKQIESALRDAELFMPLCPKKVEEIKNDKNLTRLFDQLAYRYIKLQDEMGQKLLPLVLDISLEPLPDNVTFVDKLNRLEKIGAIESKEKWIDFRHIRNSVSHEYPNSPEHQSILLNKLILAARELLLCFTKVNSFILKLRKG